MGSFPIRKRITAPSLICSWEKVVLCQGRPAMETAWMYLFSGDRFSARISMVLPCGKVMLVWS